MDRELKALMRSLEKGRRRRRVPEARYRTEMQDPGNVLEIEELKTGFFTDDGLVRSVDGVSFAVPAGKIVGVVGESGCGKSVTSLSILQLLQRPQGQILSGELRLNLGDRAYDLAKAPEEFMRRIRGNVISMIFQEPMTALDPVLTIGRQIDEVIMLHDKTRTTRQQVRRRTLELLELVGIANGPWVYKAYPHDLSGGMRQRVMIAMALACDPRLIIADEPTTALDVTIQAQILQLLKQLKEKLGSAVLLITHDLGVVAGMADFVVVMYAGRVVEQGTVEEIFYTPAHPYTLGLMASKPVVGKPVDKLYSIPGSVPDPHGLPAHCYFRERCHRAGACCQGDYPEFIHLSPTHKVSCHLVTREDRHG